MSSMFSYFFLFICVSVSVAGIQNGAEYCETGLRSRTIRAAVSGSRFTAGSDFNVMAGHLRCCFVSITQCVRGVCWCARGCVPGLCVSWKNKHQVIGIYCLTDIGSRFCALQLGFLLAVKNAHSAVAFQMRDCGTTLNTGRITLTDITVRTRVRSELLQLLISHLINSTHSPTAQ